MDGYERRKRKKMERIFGVSFELFFKHGFQKVSVNEIAHKANVSPATIYNYFGTKEQLYAETLTNWMDKQLERYESILDSGLSFPEKAKEIMLLEAKNLNLLADELQKVPSSEPGGWKRMMESYSERKVAPFFAKFVALGKREGSIRKDLSDEVAMRYFAMFNHELSRYWGSANEERTTRDLDQMMELFFYGLAGKGQSPDLPLAPYVT
ncbi:TetR/AcrR family transcriptional regulator [Paenibacillus sp. GYB003]|uniref:TetR/AcrR family transcriptional regulator n=1 Tax=Paenibacillus sp. GYB003 TaxID=2994392 RepID=UPI002F9698F6